MESSEQTHAYIYPPICTINRIFGNVAVFILFFLMLTKSHFFFSIACSVAFEDRAFKSVFLILIIDIRKTYSRAQWNLGRKAEKNRSHQAGKVSRRGVNVGCCIFSSFFMEIFVGLILFDYPLRTLARGRVGHVRRQIRIKPCGLDQSRRGPSSVDPSLRAR